MTLPGIDISSYQGTPRDWQGAAGKIAWGAVKLTELSSAGPYVSPDAEADWQYLGAHGLGRVAYMFGHPSRSSGESARFFLGELSRLGLEDGDGVALDLETSDGEAARDVDAWARNVLGLLEKALDRVPMIYTFISFAEAGNCASLGRYPLWLADISRPAGQPRVPRPWTGWVAHQYLFGPPLDRDVAAFGSLDEFRNRLGKRTAKVKGERNFTADGKTSLAAIAKACGAEASGVLRRTAIHDHAYAPELADWLNRVFAGTVPATDPVPAKVVLRVPA